MKKNENEIKLDSTRNGFGKGLLELGRTNKDIVVLSADLTESVRIHWFQKEFPDRFFGCGVAEQDMMGTAAGMALSGKIPFACTFGVFAAGRAWDQLRVSVDYMNLNVNIIGTHAGISVGEDGYTHQALEEIALMRVLPNMTMVVPGDFLEAKKATIAAAKIKGPVYIRLGRSAAPIFTKENDRFEIGKGNLIRDGGDVAIVACGQMVYEAIRAADMLLEEGIRARVINLHTMKPVDEKILIKAAKETGAIVTVEEHSIYGGLGGIVSETVCQKYPVPVRMLGVRECTQSGKPEELFKCYNLLAENVVQAAKSAIEMKI